MWLTSTAYILSHMSFFLEYNNELHPGSWYGCFFFTISLRRLIFDNIILLRRQQSKHLTHLTDQPTTQAAGFSTPQVLAGLVGDGTSVGTGISYTEIKRREKTHNNLSRQWNRWNMVFHWRKLVMKLEVFMKSLGKTHWTARRSRFFKKTTTPDSAPSSVGERGISELLGKREVVPNPADFF